MKIKKCMIVCALLALCLCLSSCGGPRADKVTMANQKFKEMQELYNQAAPVVATLDDAAVEAYDKIGKTYRKALNAESTSYDGYDSADLDKLIVDMDTAIVSLKGFASMKPVEKEPPKEDKKTYSIAVVNGTDKTYQSLILKSASGSNDVSVALTSDFVKDASVSVSAQVPQSEVFTVTATDSEGKQITFGGSFYISAVQKITLSADGESYTVKTEGTAAEKKAE